MLNDFFAADLAAELQSLIEAAAAPGRHGDMAAWRAALDALPRVEPGWHIDQGVLVAGAAAADPELLAKTLRVLIPWRKGPLRLGGVDIDTEWRSDWKWNRIAPHLDLSGARVLDIGAGNGYFGWRMLESGARQVVGCDPMLLFWHQFQAIEHFAGPSEHLLLPLKLEQIPARADFDVVFSMGVLYHRRDPIKHLQDIFEHLLPGGMAVIETLIVPGDADNLLEPPDRYANMRNVHALPTAGRLLHWLRQAGFATPRIVDATRTTPLEQRSTVWMPFHSLSQALSEDRSRTIEGHPPPLRATALAWADPVKGTRSSTKTAVL